MGRCTSTVHGCISNLTVQAMCAAGSGSVNPSIYLCAKSTVQRGKVLTCEESAGDALLRRGCTGDRAMNAITPMSSFVARNAHTQTKSPYLIINSIIEAFVRGGWNYRPRSYQFKSIRPFVYIGFRDTLSGTFRGLYTVSNHVAGSEHRRHSLR